MGLCEGSSGFYESFNGMSNKYTMYTNNGASTLKQIYEIQRDCPDIKFMQITQSTSTSTGCAIFSGGVGISKDVYIGGTTYSKIIQHYTPAAAAVDIDENVHTLTQEDLLSGFI